MDDFEIVRKKLSDYQNGAPDNNCTEALDALERIKKEYDQMNADLDC
jgi:hypothetical protein